MRRRMVLVGVLAMALAACGGSSGSPSPSSSDAGSSAAPSGSTSAPGDASPAASESVNTDSPSASLPAEGISSAVCDAISLRKSPASSGAKVNAINSGTAVHVAATVSGTAYTAGACGTSGSEWLKIDKIGGKTAKSLYGVTYVYAAAGFFQ